MKALFADIAERTRQRNKDVVAYRSAERRQVLALCDAVQIAVANGHREHAERLLQEMHEVVDSALARRNSVPASV
jgi:hypothetical protein